MPAINQMTAAEARALGLLPGTAKKPKKPKKPKKAYISKAKWDARKIPGGIVLVVPENMPSLNRWKRWHWGKQKKLLDRLTESFTLLAMVLGWPRYQRARVEIVHYFRVNRQRDSGDNYAPKFILDALRYSGVLVEDNSEVLEVPEPVFRVDRECWRTEVWVYEKR